LISADGSDTEECQATRDANASADVLVGLLSRKKNCFKRLETYTKAQLPDPMREFMVQMMVEVIGVVATATKAIKQWWISERIRVAPD
jgi:hypothetical protein